MAETPAERLARLRARLAEAAAMAAAAEAAPPEHAVEEEAEPTRPFGGTPTRAPEPRSPGRAMRSSSACDGRRMAPIAGT